MCIYILSGLTMISPSTFQSLDSKKKAEIIEEVSALFAAYSTVASTVHTLIASNAKLSDEYMNTFYSTIHQIMDDLQNNKISEAVKKLADVKSLVDRIHALEEKHKQEDVESLIENI